MYYGRPMSRSQVMALCMWWRYLALLLDKCCMVVLEELAITQAL